MRPNRQNSWWRPSRPESNEISQKGYSPILTGMQIHHNFIRSHIGLEGKTPSEVAGIRIKGDNKWITLIQNASQKQN